MRDLGKLIVAKGFKKLPTVQKIAQSGHPGNDVFKKDMLVLMRKQGGECQDIHTLF